LGGAVQGAAKSTEKAAEKGTEVTKDNAEKVADTTKKETT
jgi:hypothetical protein